jgi:hypothetical protein
LHGLRKGLKDKLEELLEPHLSIHPITYNDYLTSKVQQIQINRHDRAFDGICLSICDFTLENAHVEDMGDEELKHLLLALKDGTGPDVEKYSVSLAADVAAAYYKVTAL